MYPKGNRKRVAINRRGTRTRRGFVAAFVSLPIFIGRKAAAKEPERNSNSIGAWSPDAPVWSALISFIFTAAAWCTTAAPRRTLTTLGLEPRPKLRNFTHASYARRYRRLNCLETRVRGLCRSASRVKRNPADPAPAGNLASGRVCDTPGNRIGGGGLDMEKSLLECLWRVAN